MQNGQLREIQRRFSDELLNEHAFPTIFHARSAFETWRLDYKDLRPIPLSAARRPPSSSSFTAFLKLTVSRGLTSGATSQARRLQSLHRDLG